MASVSEVQLDNLIHDQTMLATCVSFAIRNILHHIANHPFTFYTWMHCEGNSCPAFLQAMFVAWHDLYPHHSLATLTN